ncbi:hypothetical protein COT99_02095 [Candidatus Falkowbacteria bacterium CG10_big_fil_rev_8_21_14_0_10_43_10]|uniref:PPM-type phosphatase domain-containing protein n=1 Tax=Candidatus Falkowbacteria bacterium CG10_big_fil_rev_8_21_14_0_10_43_10 TaxID=1974567 RepID=A0A2H0V4F5_9BACT|nr:MAG: hypothetical protein COT99_02095 [Candidatus Falkowbacteria bacterium CG10_big_fil_rev_8_21_14_0_10_43_10]
MYYKISRLILSPASGKSSSTADIFISNPQIDQEALLGKLFFIAEIENKKPIALKIINFFISALPAHYYHNEKISLREKMGTIRIGEIFETALAKTNAEFEAFLKKEKVKIDPKLLNIIVGVVYKNDLVFSSAGKIKAMLIYHDKTEEEEDKKIYKITAINDQEGPAKIQLNKIFSNITEGKIPSEGYLVFANEILPEYINNRHLTKIITTLPPTSAIEYLKGQLHKINSYVTFLAIIIKNSTTPHVKRSIPRMQVNVTASNSLELMNETENETEKYLSPVGIISANRYLAALKKIGAKITGSREKKITTAIRDKIFLVKKHRLNFLTRLRYHGKNFFTYAFNIIIYFTRLLSHPKELSLKSFRAVKNIWLAVKTSALKSFHWFINLSAISKVWLMTFVVCSGLFAYGIIQVTRNKTQQAEQQSYEELIQLVKQKQNQIEASLLYNNEVKAQELIVETSGIIDQLKNFKKIDQNLIDNFTAVNREQTDKISHVVDIKNPKELANFSQLNSAANPRLIIPLGRDIIASDADNKSLYQFNLADNTAGLLNKDAKNISYGAKSSDGKAVFISASGGLIVDKDLNISEINSAITENPGEITDIAFYNGRLYVMSAARNNIFRYARDYQSRDAWIKEDLDIKNAVSFTIDGYIYALLNDGRILKMLSGYSNEFEFAPVNPPLTAPAKFKMTGENENGYIYILEPAGKRLLVFDKNGKFIMQYRIEGLSDWRDFAVIEEEKKIIILSGASIYEIEIKHLK